MRLGFSGFTKNKSPKMGQNKACGLFGGSKAKAPKESKNPDRVIRKSDFASGGMFGKTGQIRKNLRGMKTMKLKARKKGTTDKFKTEELKTNNKIVDVFKNSDIINKTERRVEAKMKRAESFSSKDKNGNVIEVKFGSDNMSRNKKKIFKEALIVEEKPVEEGPTQEQIDKNVAASRAVDGRIQTKQSVSDNNSREDKLKILRKAKKEAEEKITSKGIGVEEVETIGSIQQKDQEESVSVENGGGKISAGEVKKASATIGGGEDVASITGGSQKKESKSKTIYFKEKKKNRGGTVQLAASGSGTGAVGVPDRGPAFKITPGGMRSDKEWLQEKKKIENGMGNFLGEMRMTSNEKKKMLMESLKQKYAAADDYGEAGSDNEENNNEKAVKLDDYQEVDSLADEELNDEPIAAAGGS